MLKFGTDGIRGRANAELTPALALAVGAATAEVFGGLPVVVGRDTRESGPMLQSALSAGIMGTGSDVVDLGVVPTGLIAFVSATMGQPAVVVSASHNPYFDNGLKVFSPGGRKLSNDDQMELEGRIAEHLAGRVESGAARVGQVLPAVFDAEYSDRILGAAGRLDGSGLKVALDFANGASVAIGSALFESLGVEVVGVLGSRPDGRNINNRCGSTHPEALCDLVRTTSADVGLAFDGDADRVLAVDERGSVVDGDQMLAVFARAFKSSGRLVGNGIVATVMSNLGLHRAMATVGVEVILTPVGDRFVLDALDEFGFILGGEQSGHIIFADYATTGDGLLTGAMLLSQLASGGQRLSELVDTAMVKYPQLLRSVRVDDPARIEISSDIRAAVAAIEAQLGDSGRVVLRASGTEPVIRVMVEAETEVLAESAVAQLIEIITFHL